MANFIGGSDISLIINSISFLVCTSKRFLFLTGRRVFVPRKGFLINGYLLSKKEKKEEQEKTNARMLKL